MIEQTIAVLTSGVLVAIAALHAAWGAGITWPERDGAALARRVAGFRGVSRMPGAAACFAVAAMLLLGALALLAGAGTFGDAMRPWPVGVVLVAMAAVFAARGIAAWHPRWRALTPEQPFARLDRQIYSPLCLAIAVGTGVTAAASFEGGI